MKLADRRIVIVETKGLVDEDVPQKIERLKQWCADVNGKKSGVAYDFVYVDEESFKRYKPKTFSELLKGFKHYKD